MKNVVEIPDNQLGYLFTQVSFLKQRIVNAALKELDITYMQFIILAGTLELGADDKIVTQQDIAARRRLDKAMVSNVVKTLVDKGLMERCVHPVDKRAYRLSLTQTGIQTALDGKKIAQEVDKTFFARVDKKELLATLHTLIENEGGAE